MDPVIVWISSEFLFRLDSVYNSSPNRLEAQSEEKIRSSEGSEIGKLDSADHAPLNKIGVALISHPWESNIYATFHWTRSDLLQQRQQSSQKEPYRSLFPVALQLHQLAGNLNAFQKRSPAWPSFSV